MTLIEFYVTAIGNVSRGFIANASYSFTLALYRGKRETRGYHVGPYIPYGKISVIGNIIPGFPTKYREIYLLVAP